MFSNLKSKIIEFWGLATGYGMAAYVKEAYRRLIESTEAGKSGAARAGPSSRNCIATSQTGSARTGGGYRIRRRRGTSRWWIDVALLPPVTIVTNMRRIVTARSPS